MLPFILSKVIAPSILPLMRQCVHCPCMTHHSSLIGWEPLTQLRLRMEAETRPHRAGHANVLVSSFIVEADSSRLNQSELKLSDLDQWQTEAVSVSPALTHPHPQLWRPQPRPQPASGPSLWPVAVSASIKTGCGRIKLSTLLTMVNI